MKIPRRQFLRLAAGAAAFPAVSRIASAQTYPTRSVRIIVGFAAGSGADLSARLIGQWLSERLGQPIIIENRPGAGSNIAAESVVRAPPDGHVLLLVQSAHAIGATLYDKLSFNIVRDISPIARISQSPLVMVVHPSVPAKTLPEFIAYARANPGRINMASSGNGSTQHVAGEQFKMMAGVDMVHVPYRGGAAALTDLLAGQVQVIFDVLSNSIEPVRAGKLRALAMTSAVRADPLPSLPTVREFVPGYEASAWSGVGAPRHTPTEIIERLNREINAGLADPKIKAKYVDLGYALVEGSPADFGKFIAEETEKLGKVVRAANIKPD